MSNYLTLLNNALEAIQQLNEHPQSKYLWLDVAKDLETLNTWRKYGL